MTTAIRFTASCAVTMKKDDVPSGELRSGMRPNLVLDDSYYPCAIELASAMPPGTEAEISVTAIAEDHDVPKFSAGRGIELRAGLKALAKGKILRVEKQEAV